MMGSLVVLVVERVSELEEFCVRCELTLHPPIVEANVCVHREGIVLSIPVSILTVDLGGIVLDSALKS